jgi:hypothetical protein
MCPPLEIPSVDVDVEVVGTWVDMMARFPAEIRFSSSFSISLLDFFFFTPARSRNNAILASAS